MNESNDQSSETKREVVVNREALGSFRVIGSADQ